MWHLAVLFNCNDSKKERFDSQRFRRGQEEGVKKEGRREFRDRKRDDGFVTENGHEF